ncbi:MAG: SAM-dependent methyltransferase [Lysobacterales bacterium CG02_land_8_20_14_3_00_62_12]|nr:MAG: SAM-dependent methyltransferase [Xanthomonadales bacterium CG02_land_8_20_14_3_00_62_12]
MTVAFKDHFSQVSEHYAEHRPRYPSALFDWLAAQCAEHELAWDCATGNGQAATELGRVFQRVIATDASAAQIAQAVAHPRVFYQVTSAATSDIDTGSVDLISVAQALHWFDLPRFYAEARRVLKPEGRIAIWSYGLHSLSHRALDACIDRFYRDRLGAYWPAERRHVETGYRDLAFPFTAIHAPTFVMQMRWTLDQLLGYLRSWSASGRYQAATGIDPVSELEPELRALWGDAAAPRSITWPLLLRFGRR